MYKFNIVLSVGYLVFMSSAATAQTSAGNSQDENSVYRSIHSQSYAVPDGVAFASLIRSIVSVADEDPLFANTWLAQELRLTETKAAHIMSLFRIAITDMAADKNRKKHEIGCTSGVPAVYGENTYAALEQMDDSDETVAESHFLRVKNEVAEDTAARLHAWVESNKTNVVYMRHDHKKLSNKIGRDGYERLGRICQLFYAESQKETRR